MHADFDDTMARGLRRYVSLVSKALALGGECFFIQPEPPATAYLPLDERLPGHPSHDVALTWTESQGWTLVLETDSGGDEPVARLTEDLLPPPSQVAAWARGILNVPEQSLCVNGCPTDENLPERLADYAKPLLSTP